MEHSDENMHIGVVAYQVNRWHMHVPHHVLSRGDFVM